MNANTFWDRSKQSCAIMLHLSEARAHLRSGRAAFRWHFPAVFFFFCLRLRARLRSRSLAVISTVSSPLNLGMYWSPRRISASFSGLKRHITLTPHSDASTMTAAPLTPPSEIQNGAKKEEKRRPAQSGLQTTALCCSTLEWHRFFRWIPTLPASSGALLSERAAPVPSRPGLSPA